MVDEVKQYYEGYLINFSSSSGYPTIFVNSKNVLLHRFVWEKHYGKIPKGYEVHHKDENKHNYSIDNLILIESKEHHRYHALKHNLGVGNKNKPKMHISGFCGTPVQVIAAKGDKIFNFNSISECSKVLELDYKSVARVVCGVRKTYKGWKFERA